MTISTTSYQTEFPNPSHLSFLPNPLAIWQHLDYLMSHYEYDKWGDKVWIGIHCLQRLARADFRVMVMDRTKLFVPSLFSSPKMLLMRPFGHLIAAWLIHCFIMSKTNDEWRGLNWNSWSIKVSMIWLLNHWRDKVVCAIPIFITISTMCIGIFSHLTQLDWFNVLLWVWQMVRQGINWNSWSLKVSMIWLLSHV